MSTRQEVRYEGTPCKVLAMLENAVILRRESGAEFTAVLNDPAITIRDLPELGEAGQANEPTPGDTQDVLDNIELDDDSEWYPSDDPMPNAEQP